MRADVIAVDGACAVEPALAHALADELVGLTGLLADLAFDLAGNPDTLRHHMHSLQGVDRITQAQLAIAELLRASTPVERRLEAVTLEELGANLRESFDRYRRDGVPIGPDIDDTA
ncbi:hypothetical protein [Sphingomonas sp. CLY1604]|uniref:hypothetical protein n=1 Tax=Sphingomonas sp. CLY1604 TaxID=3457786 RepID=UPI003FD77BB0